MRVFVVALVLCSVAVLAKLNLDAPAINDNIIDYVNNHVNATWTAGHNKYFKGTTLRYAKSLCGTLRGGPRLPAKRYLPTVQDIPASFDSRTKWSSICPSTAEVRD
jgi:cathepsin B